ncbi:hypothetical protein Daura_29145 [Dactylosporangium aurantiacum]|uniref:Lipoprotein n=1 Tax=Dactylosporangium aurantiacum TaxID=35754 RepID=A0A9Q9IAS2_9ACTN|nr:hypothetical protein [Dactylosporangium aurantiacum]MDG6106721.1 hypothetical protein [Dactylosporangium aurantiacum]UWZ50868.1 hypothetical protein Daura_29145 [Dactylosporangium aurantiacum]
MTRRVLAALLLPLLLLAACTTADDGARVASAGGTATPGSTPTLSFQEQGLRHARCMREHGVPEADPVVDGNGNVRVGGGYDKGSIDGEVLERAVAACEQYRPVLDAGELAGKLDVAREESRCMRAHGVEDFPDPEPDLDLEVPDSARQDPQYEEARAACIRHGGRSPAPSR